VRTKLIRQTVLETLSMAHGYALPDETLHRHVDALMRPPLSGDEWEQTTGWLEKNNHITRVASDLDEALVQWSITERGRTILATL
jgi:hypothetical protein